MEFRREQVDDAGDVIREAETVINILTDANRSTMIHELGHVFLENRRRLMMDMGDVLTDTAREDWTTLTQWLDVSDIDFGRPMTEEQAKRWRDAQEKFAAGFEKFCMTGKAPSSRLSKAFRSFRRWLLKIYQSLSGITYRDTEGRAVAFTLSDEVREVMGRLLATEEEIENNRAIIQARETAEALAALGIPDDEAAQYRDIVEEAIDKAKGNLYSKLSAELKKEKRAELREARKAVKGQAEAEVAARPEYKAFEWFTRGQEDGGIRLSMPDLIARYGEDGAKKTARGLPLGVVQNDGTALADAAALLGYSAPEALLEDLRKVRAVPPAAAVKARVEELTAKEASILNDPDALKMEVEKALHTGERAEWLAMEARMMAEAGENAAASIETKRVSVSELRRKTAARENRQQAAAWAKAAQETAHKIIAGKVLKDVSPVRYIAAEKRAATRAAVALERGEFQKARKWKQEEILQNALAREAVEVREAYLRGQDFMRRFTHDRKRLRKVIGRGAFDQVAGLLNHFGWMQEETTLEKRGRLSNWLSAQMEETENAPSVAGWIRDLDVTGAKMSMSNLTLEQFFALRDAVAVIEHLGRNERTLIAATEAADMDEAISRLREAAFETFGTPADGDMGAYGVGVLDPNAPRAGAVSRFLSSLERPETIFRRMDGLKDMGTFWRVFYEPVQRASDAEIRRGTEAKAKLDAIFKKHFPDRAEFVKLLEKQIDTRMFDPGTGKKIYWTGEQMLAAMLNWGNLHNRERLVFGEGFVASVLHGQVKPADDAQYQMMYNAGAAAAQALFDNWSTKNEWEFCQDVWDFIDEFWPDIRKLEENINGAAPDKVEAAPVRLKDGTVLRGGYYPVKFDGERNWTSLERGEKENARALYENQFQRAATRHGHTKDRVERVSALPLSLSLNVIGEHVTNVIHDLCFRPVVRDLTKLTKNEQVRSLLSWGVGDEAYKQMNPWIQGLAAPAVTNDPASRIFGKFCGLAAAAQLGASLTVALGQAAGYVTAIPKLGWAGTARAIARVFTSEGFFSPKVRDRIFELSPELRDRMNGTDRNVRAGLEAVRRNRRQTWLEQANIAVNIGVQWADMAIAFPVWQEAYNQGLTKRGYEQQQAVDYADYIVRTTQNTALTKDTAWFQRGGMLAKLLTMYYSAFGGMYQQFREECARLGRRGAPGVLPFTAFCVTMFVVQTVVEDLVKHRTPWDEEEPPEPESVAKWLVAGSLGNFAEMFPMARDVASGAQMAFGGYRLTPATAILESTTKTIGVVGGDAWDLLMGRTSDLDIGRDVERLAETSGYILGLPTIQLMRWYRTFSRWVNNEPDFSPWEVIWAKRGR